MQVRTVALEGNKYFPLVGLFGFRFSAVFALLFEKGAYFQHGFVFFSSITSKIEYLHLIKKIALEK